MTVEAVAANVIPPSTNGHSPAGYEPPTSTVLRWDEGPFAGARVRILLSGAIREVVGRWQQQEATAGDALDQNAPPPAEPSAITRFEERLQRLVKQRIAAWNLVESAPDPSGELDDDGLPKLIKQPAPITVEYLMGKPTDFVLELLKRAESVAIGLPDPLSVPSSNGSSLPAESTQMETKSANRRNSHTRK